MNEFTSRLHDYYLFLPPFWITVVCILTQIVTILTRHVAILTKVASILFLFLFCCHSDQHTNHRSTFYLITVYFTFPSPSVLPPYAYSIIGDVLIIGDVCLGKTPEHSKKCSMLAKAGREHPWRANAMGSVSLITVECFHIPDEHEKPYSVRITYI